MNGLSAFLIPSLLIFATGLAGMLFKKNLLAIFMCMELMLCGAMLAFVAFAFAHGDPSGAVFGFFIMAIAAAEVAVALAVIVQFFKVRRSVSSDDVDTLGE
jgi:NADH:ubiquinone oxidoreductase subunit 11 or 4L (chain K)